MSIGSVISTNVVVKLDGIDVTIKRIRVSNSYTNINYGFKSINVPSSNQSIELIGVISNKHYLSLDKWFNGIFRGNISGYSTAQYKKDLVFNTMQIKGIFPTDYNFNTTGIEVTFSADYISGDLHLFQLQQVRKAKLKKLNSLQ
jgi:hypothetical protein